AIARISEQCRAVASCQPQDLRTSVRSRLPVLIHPAKMGDHNPSRLTVLHGRSRPVDDLDQDMTLSNVVVAWVVRTGDGKQAEFRRAVEVADRLDALLSSPRQTVGG